MPRKTFTEEQIVAALKKAESGVSVADVCRQTGVTEMTFYRWKRKYAGLGIAELRRLKLSTPVVKSPNHRLKIPQFCWPF